MIINSLDNKLIKHAASLKQKKFREQSGEFLAEGLRSVIDILKSCPISVKTIFVSDTDGFCRALKNAGLDTENEEINQKIVQIPPPLMQKISDTATPQEVAAIVGQKAENEPCDFCVYLDRIRDPGNLGTIIRCAAAAGYSLILDDCADLFSPKVVRSSMSAIMSANFCFAGQSKLTELKSRGYTVIAADASGKNLYELTANDLKATKICIVIGNEAQGISEDIFAQCDRCVSIPISGVESLNAAVSAAIMMFHLKFSLK